MFEYQQAQTYNNQLNIHTTKQTNKQSNKQTNKQTNRQTNKQANKQTAKQTINVTSSRNRTKNSFNKSKMCESRWPTWQVFEIKKDLTKKWNDIPQPLTPNSEREWQSSHYRKSPKTRNCAICQYIFKVSTEECPEIQISHVCGWWRKLRNQHERTRRATFDQF